MKEYPDYFKSFERIERLIDWALSRPPKIELKIPNKKLIAKEIEKYLGKQPQA